MARAFSGQGGLRHFEPFSFFLNKSRKSPGYVFLRPRLSGRTANQLRQRFTVSIMHPPTQFDQPAPVLEANHPCGDCIVRCKAICSVLDSDELKAFRRTGATIRLAPGETLFYEDDPARSVYSLTRGMLRLTKILPDGRRQIADFLFPGDFLGLTLEEGHSFSAEAVTEVEVCQFSTARFQAFATTHPQLERRLFALAAHERAATRQQVLRLGRKSAMERIASFLMMLANRDRDVPVSPEGRLMVVLPMSRTDIGDYLGLRIETISREFSAMKAQGLIRLVSTQRVEILDPERLEAIAAGEALPERSLCAH